MGKLTIKLAGAILAAALLSGCAGDMMTVGFGGRDPYYYDYYRRPPTYFDVGFYPSSGYWYNDHVYHDGYWYDHGWGTPYYDYYWGDYPYWYY